MSGEETILRVALPLPLPQLFDYLPPAASQPAPEWIGRRVRVPFGKGTKIGVIAALAPDAGGLHSLKPIDTLLDPRPLFTQELWQTLHWAAGYYQRALGEVLATALPLALRAGDAPAAAGRDGWTNVYGEPPGGVLREGSRPQRLLQLLEREGPLDETQLDQRLPGWREPMRSLVRRRWVQRVRLAAAPPAAPRRTAPPLNSDQQAAVDAVVASLDGFGCMLLDGVTGSGKTEVYLAAIEACVARGRQALVLVPEIGLTPQALQRYGERLPVGVHALHSGLSERERLHAWSAMSSGEARVLIGTRSAVFAPLPEPGLIIVDEEHDASFKQQEGFRYHARDLALVRAKALRIPVILGSATPALESIANAHSGRYRLLRLPHRAGNAQPPSFHVLDVRSLPLRDGLSAPLRKALDDCLARGEQALVFRNRRGYAPCLLCHDCGWSAQCTRCDRPMTLHGRRSLLCHHCGARRVVPPACPECHGLALTPQGAGTERLEQALAHAFPEATLVRVDRETTQSRDALERHFAKLGDRPGLLVGTQMLAKGHDLPNLTLVAIADIDDGLFSADFRASERLAQLLVQVAGRAGRARRPGQVWLQTHHPQHPLLQTLLSGGYPAFAEAALKERAAAGFPPFTYLALLRAEAGDMARVEGFLHIAHRLLQAQPDIQVYAPMPAPMPRRAGRHRGQLLLCATARASLQQALQAAMPGLRAAREGRRVRWSVDVDPTDLY